VALLALAILTAPFSIWPGNTREFFLIQLPVIAGAMVVCWKISFNWRVFRGVLRLLVVAGVALALTAVAAFHGGGRASTTESMDPNDLAYVLVSVAPLALAFALTAKTKMKRLISTSVCLVLVIAVLLTSSRGGLFGLIAALGLLVLAPIRRPQAGPGGDSTVRNRILLPTLGVVCAAMLLWPYLPAQTRDRLASVMQLGSDYNLDTTNKNSRSAIWERGLSAALQRPIGYGIQTYPMVDWPTRPCCGCCLQR
jgi:hypothetical protein